MPLKFPDSFSRTAVRHPSEKQVYDACDGAVKITNNCHRGMVIDDKCSCLCLAKRFAALLSAKVRNNLSDRLGERMKAMEYDGPLTALLVTVIELHRI